MEVEIEVPSHFLCPISMQPMKDPVTISTGITYDRESIQRWLFTCKRTTCPVTKQPLSATDLIPNHTLRRLIHSWYSLNSHHNFDLIPTPNKPLDRLQIVKLLNDAKTHPQNQITCLRSIRPVAHTCMEDNLGVFEFVTRLIMEENEVDLVTEALMVLHHLKLTDLKIQKLVVGNEVRLLNALLHVMRFGSVQSRSHAITFLRSVFKVMDPGHVSGVNPELFNQTVRILKDNVSHSQQTIKSSLEVVVETVRCGRNRVKAAESGMVLVLVDRLIESSDRRACELILVALEQICRCAVGRAKLVEHAAGLAAVSKKILRVSHVGSDRAVRILGLVCRFCGSCGVVQEMVEVGVVSKLCLMIQIDYSDRTKERVKEILMLHSRAWKDASCVPAHLLSSYPSL
ncbi:hypothetical protein L1987_33180 [Smallanthus sonchifolius]|uniref:Uncharacterized protein n=1 Tax=Smallanthus sonchifolius TaxID=185202 RepID=A0ACB9HR04_9ASTR|nr:hypothetical protein L1987_33180 [Smallanthus sonchifolius]